MSFDHFQLGWCQGRPSDFHAVRFAAAGVRERGERAGRDDFSCRKGRCPGLCGQDPSQPTEGQKRAPQGVTPLRLEALASAERDLERLQHGGGVPGSLRTHRPGNPDHERRVHAEVGDRLRGGEAPVRVVGVHDLEPHRRPFNAARQLFGRRLAVRDRRAELEHDFAGEYETFLLCQRVSYGFAGEYETFLRAVLAKNPHKGVQGEATLSLGRFLNNRLQRIDLCRDQPGLADEFAGLFGKAYLAELKRQKRDKVLKEIEAAFEQAAEKYGDVKLPGGETVAGLAKAELFSIRNLSVGKEAPDIAGFDQDGRRFKLSDYRGKVVLLDFWSFV
jgi:hypothetical protein